MALLMARYLVTGGAGFIGSHVVDALIARGHQVRVLDDLSTGTPDNLSQHDGRIEFIQGDIRSREALERACRGVESVIHEAAWRSVPKSMEDPVGYMEVNVVGTANLLEASRQAGVKRLVFVSSSSVYGQTERLPLREQDPTEPISPYALSKLAGEQLCRLFTGSFGLETVSLRYFNVFGPRQSLDNAYAVVVPKFITSLLRGESPPVYGDGAQTRDFTYVENVVEGTIAASQAPGVSGEVLNLALGEQHSVLELLAELNAILGTSRPPRFEPPRPGDVQHTRADPSKAQRLLGWRGGVSFGEGLRRTAEWFRNQRIAYSV
jgi:nucleoside-diphosphate-sugar epimerase